MTSQHSKGSQFFRELGYYYSFLDAFNVPNRLYYAGEERYRTGLGATMTIGVVALLVSLSIGAIQSTLNKNEFDLITNVFFEEKPSLLNLNQDNFMIAVKLDDPDHDFNDSMIGIRMLQRTFINEDGQQIKEKELIPLRKCQMDDFQNFTQDYIRDNLQNALCPEKIDFNISGSFEQELFEFLEISFEECEDELHSSSSITCAPKELQENYKETMKVRGEVYVKSNTFIQDDLLSPFKPILRKLNFILNFETIKQSTDLFLRNNDLTSAQDLFDSTKITFSGITYDDEFTNQVQTSDPGNTEYLTVQIRKSNFNVQIRRTFQNLAVLLAYIGGIWAVLYRAGKVCGQFLNRYSYEKTIADELYSYQLDGKDEQNRLKKEDISQSRRISLRKNKVNPSDSSSPNQANKVLDEGNEKQKINNLLSKASIVKNKVFTGYMHYFIVRVFCFCTKRNSRKLTQQEEGIRLARLKLDVRYIMRKIQEFEKIKHLILDDKQRAIFDYIPAPTIPIPGKGFRKTNTYQREVPRLAALEEFKGMKLVESYDDTSQVMKLYEIYKEIKRQPGISQKVIEMLGKKALGLFKSVDLISSQLRILGSQYKNSPKLAKMVRKHKDYFIKTMNELNLDYTMNSQFQYDPNAFRHYKTRAKSMVFGYERGDSTSGTNNNDSLFSPGNGAIHPPYGYHKKISNDSNFLNVNYLSPGGQQQRALTEVEERDMEQSDRLSRLSIEESFEVGSNRHLTTNHHVMPNTGNYGSNNNHNHHPYNHSNSNNSAGGGHNHFVIPVSSLDQDELNRHQELLSENQSSARPSTRRRMEGEQPMIKINKIDSGEHIIIPEVSEDASSKPNSQQTLTDLAEQNPQQHAKKINLFAQSLSQYNGNHASKQQSPQKEARKSLNKSQNLEFSKGESEDHLLPKSMNQVRSITDVETDSDKDLFSNREESGKDSTSKEEQPTSQQQSELKIQPQKPTSQLFQKITKRIPMISHSSSDSESNLTPINKEKKRDIPSIFRVNLLNVNDDLGDKEN